MFSSPLMHASPEVATNQALIGSCVAPCGMMPSCFINWVMSVAAMKALMQAPSVPMTTLAMPMKVDRSGDAYESGVDAGADVVTRLPV